MIHFFDLIPGNSGKIFVRRHLSNPHRLIANHAQDLLPRAGLVRPAAKLQFIRQLYAAHVEQRAKHAETSRHTMSGNGKSSHLGDSSHHRPPKRVVFAANGPQQQLFDPDRGLRVLRVETGGGGGDPPLRQKPVEKFTAIRYGHHKQMRYLEDYGYGFQQFMPRRPVHPGFQHRQKIFVQREIFAAHRPARRLQGQRSKPFQVAPPQGIAACAAGKSGHHVKRFG